MATRRLYAESGQLCGQETAPRMWMGGVETSRVGSACTQHVPKSWLKRRQERAPHKLDPLGEECADRLDRFIPIYTHQHLHTAGSMPGAWASSNLVVVLQACRYKYVVCGGYKSEVDHLQVIHSSIDPEPNMHFLKTLTVAAIALATLVHGSPVPQDPAVDQLEQASVVAKRSTAGFNDWKCKPSSAHPRALVLVHGMSGNAIDNWLYMAPRFVAKGYCVFALSYGQLNRVPIIYGLDKIENSAQQLSEFIDKVLAATNTTQVDILGHSEGSFMPRYYLKRLGGAPKVHKFAGIGAVNQGSTLRGLIMLLQPLGLYDPVLKTIDPLCHACLQLLKGSAFLNDLNDGGDTVPGVVYLTLVTKYDEIVTPYTSGFLLDKNPKVQNHVLQDWCALDLSDHLLIAFDPIVFNALHAFFTPSADQRITCADIQ